MALKERMHSARMNGRTPIACTIGFLFLFAFSVYGDSPLSIELVPYIGRLKTVSVELNGKKHAFLFDTAGGVTILTPEVAKEICEPFGRITLFRMSGQRLDLQQCGAQTIKMGDFEIQAETAVLDLIYDGALNAAVLEKLVLTIHFRTNKIWGKIHP